MLSVGVFIVMLSATAPSIKTFSITTISIMASKCPNADLNLYCHLCSVSFMLSVILQSVSYIECHYADCHLCCVILLSGNYAKCHFVNCRGAQIMTACHHPAGPKFYPFECNNTNNYCNWTNRGSPW